MTPGSEELHPGGGGQGEGGGTAWSWVGLVLPIAEHQAHGSAQCPVCLAPTTQRT